MSERNIFLIGVMLISAGICILYPSVPDRVGTVVDIGNYAYDNDKFLIVDYGDNSDFEEIRTSYANSYKYKINSKYTERNHTQRMFNKILKCIVLGIGVSLVVLNVKIKIKE